MRRICLSVALFASPALAATGYRGDYRLQTELKSNIRTVHGKVQTDGQKLRIDFKEHNLGDLVLDFGAQKGFILFPEAKRYQDVDIAALGAPLPRCGDKKPAACYQAAGFVKAATEQVNDVKCERWENPAQQLTVWTAPGMPDLIYVKMRVKEADGSVKVHDLLSLVPGDIPAATFERPAGYVKN
jgi:hypothetical protein